MKLAEVIKALQKEERKHGPDIQVRVWDYTEGIDALEVTDIYSYEEKDVVYVELAIGLGE